MAEWEQWRDIMTIDAMSSEESDMEEGDQLADSTQAYRIILLRILIFSIIISLRNAPNS